MIDFFLQTREKMIENLQASLRSVRQLINLSAQELGELVGLTRQTINNLETGKSSMSATQYVAICAVLDKVLIEKPEILQALTAVINAANPAAESSFNGEIINIHNRSFLEKWFLCFPNKDGFIGDSISINNYVDDTSLNAIARNYKVFINHDSITTASARDFLIKFSVLLKNNDNKLIVPLRVVEMLQNSMLSSDKTEVQNAKNGLKLLSNLQSQDVVQIRGEQTDDKITNLIFSVFAKHKSNYRLMLITQDEKFAMDILTLNEKQSLPGFPIIVSFIDASGNLKIYNENKILEDTDFGVIEEGDNEEITTEDIDNESGKASAESFVAKGWDTIG